MKGHYMVNSGTEEWGVCRVDVIAKQFGEKTQHSGPAPEKQSYPCHMGWTICDLIDCFSLKTCDLIYSQEFSFLTILWPLLSSKSTQQEGKGRFSINPFHMGPIRCPISSLFTQPSISEPGRSGLLLTLIKWFGNGQISPTHCVNRA